MNHSRSSSTAHTHTHTNVRRSDKRFTAIAVAAFLCFLFGVSENLFGQYTDLPTLRYYCADSTGQNPIDSIFTYSTRNTRIDVISDTTICKDFWIGADTMLIIHPHVTLYFNADARLIINGGVLQIGEPTPPSPPNSSQGLRPQDQDCDCAQVLLTSASSHQDSVWNGILVKQTTTVTDSTIAYIYGADISKARTGITVEGPRHPLDDWCNDLIEYTVADPPFVWIECTNLTNPPDTMGFFPQTRSAGIYLHGKAAASTIVNRVNVQCDRLWQEGIMIHGDSLYGPCRAPNVGSCYVEDAVKAGFHIVHAREVCGGIDTYTEVVGHGWYAKDCMYSGVKIYGASRVRFTECEGGLRVMTDTTGLFVDSGSTGNQHFSLYLSSGDHYDSGIGARHAGLYMNHFMSSFELGFPQECNIICQNGAEVIDSGYVLSMRLTVYSGLREQIRCYDDSYVYISYDTTSSSGKFAYHRDMRSGKNTDPGDFYNSFYADGTSTIGIVKAFFTGALSDPYPGGDTTNSNYAQRIAYGGGTFILRDTTAYDLPLQPLLVWFCDGTGANSSYKNEREPVSALRSGDLHISTFPNPFGSSSPHHIEYATFELIIDKPMRATIAIYDIAGNKIKLLGEGVYYDKGMHFVQWRGDNHSGELVGNGTYYLVVQSKDGASVQPVTYLR